jgi:integrase
VSESTCAKAYRLLRAILNTAVADGILKRNPCRIPGAGVEHPAERPTLTIEQVMALSQQMPPRFSALVIVATFGSLRYGEATALHREDVDVAERTVAVRAAFIERSTGAMELGPPKSRAGVRTVVLPRFATRALAEHLDRYVGPEPEALIFTGVKGGPLRRSQFNPTVGWREAVTAIGVPGPKI